MPPTEPKPQELTAEEGWIDAPVLGVYRPSYSFVTGDPQGDRIRIAYWRRVHDQAYVGKVWFGPRAEGPPLSAHGGAVAAVLDDVMGRGVWVAGHKVLAGSLSFTYRSRTPLHKIHKMEAYIERIEGRKVFAVARLEALDGTLRAESQGVFIKIDASIFEAEKARLEAAGYPTWTTELADS